MELLKEITVIINVIALVVSVVMALRLRKMTNEMDKIMKREANKAMTEMQVRLSAEHYSKRAIWNKAKQDMEECLEELYGAGNPFNYEDVVNMTENTWKKVADTIITLNQLIAQHKKEKVVMQQIDHKLSSQTKQILEERRTAQVMEHESD